MSPIIECGEHLEVVCVDVTPWTARGSVEWHQYNLCYSCLCLDGHMRGAHVHISIDICTHTFLINISINTYACATYWLHVCIFIWTICWPSVFIWLKPEDCTVCIILTKTYTRALSFLYGSGATVRSTIWPCEEANLKFGKYHGGDRWGRLYPRAIG